MTWTTGYYYLPQYKHSGCNQYGDRFKLGPQKRLSVARLTCKSNDSAGLTRLVLLSHHLNVPVHYDFEDHTVYIEVMSADAIRGSN